MLNAMLSHIHMPKCNQSCWYGFRVVKGAGLGLVFIPVMADQINSPHTGCPRLRDPYWMRHLHEQNTCTTQFHFK